MSKSCGQQRLSALLRSVEFGRAASNLTKTGHDLASTSTARHTIWLRRAPEHKEVRIMLKDYVPTWTIVWLT